MTGIRQLCAVGITSAALLTGVGMAPPSSASPAHQQTTVSQPVMARHYRSSLGNRAVWLASRQRGKPFVYGAAGPWAFDCSGLVQYVYRHLGRSLPHNAAAQYWTSRHISRRSARPGDLIFLQRHGHVYHVGIYAGRGRWWGSWHRGTRVSQHHVPYRRVLVGRVY